MSNPKYPNVYCPEHDKTAPGYMICKHVKKVEDAVYMETATEQSLGVVCCKACLQHKKDTEYIIENFDIACADSVKELGLLAERTN